MNKCLGCGEEYECDCWEYEKHPPFLVTIALGVLLFPFFLAGKAWYYINGIDGQP